MKRLLAIFSLLAIGSVTCAQNGRVGIGTTNPLAGLHVTDSSVLFSAPGDVGSTTNLLAPISGSGRRMLWWPGKAAFRAGFVNSTQWDKDSIGIYSFAGGFGTKAVGTASTALGFGSTARGLFSTALGSGTIAAGNYSLAAGISSVAAGSVALAIGQESYANAAVANAIGYQDTALGNASVALGGGLYTRSFGEVAVGAFNQNYTPVLSDGYYPDDRAFTIGIGSANNDRRNALTVLKNGRLGLGVVNPFSQLSNNSKNTIGSDGNGGNPGSFSWSANQYGYAAQIYNEGNSSASNGLAVKVGNNNAMVLDISQGLQEGGGNPLFNVRANGYIGIGTNTPVVKIDVMGGTALQEMRLCGGRGQTDNNGILIIHDSSNNTAPNGANELLLFLNAPGGIIGSVTRVANASAVSYNTTSDIRLKANIHPTQYGLNDLMAIQVADYVYKGTQNATPQTGFLAQQLYKIFPPAVTKGDDEDVNQPYMVDYGKLTPLLVKSLQELKTQVDDLQKEKQSLNTTITSLEERLKKLESLVELKAVVADGSK